MLGLLSLVGLVAFTLVRPVDLFPAFQGIPVLPLLALATLSGLGLDASLGRIKGRATPLVVGFGAWLAWGIVTAIASPTAAVVELASSHLLPTALFLALALGVRDLEAFDVVAAAVVLSTTWVGLLCVHQATQPSTCVALASDDDLASPAVSDGRACELVEDCTRAPPDPMATYRCERTGWFATTTVDGGRVRYVGVLHDPNEAALAVALSVPLAVGLHRRRRSLARAALLAACLATATGTVLASRSRTGALVLAALPVAGAVALRRTKVVVGAGLAGTLVALVGGRSGERAAASTAERLEIWQEGLAMLRGHPLVGVGRGQFTEHHPLTAHNAFLLAAAEEGLPGLVIWTGVLALALGLLPCARRDRRGPTAADGWTAALRCSLAGLAVGAVFLSLNRHAVTWLYLGLAAALARLGEASGPRRPRTPGLADVAVAACLAGFALAGVAAAARTP